MLPGETLYGEKYIVVYILHKCSDIPINHFFKKNVEPSFLRKGVSKQDTVDNY